MAWGLEVLLKGFTILWLREDSFSTFSPRGWYGFYLFCKFYYFLVLKWNKNSHVQKCIRREDPKKSSALCCLGYQEALCVMIWALLGHWGIQDGSLSPPAMPRVSLNRWIIDLIDQRFSSQQTPLFSNCHHLSYERCHTGNVMAMAVEWWTMLLSPAPAWSFSRGGFGW